jgi:hypothetical protein
MVGQVNNQAPAHAPAREWKHVQMISEGTSTKSETNYNSCRKFAKEACN